MDRSKFIQTMEIIKLQYDKREAFCDKIQEVLGMKIVEDIYETDFFNILISTIETAINDNGKNITYLIYECNFNLATMESKIENYDGTPVILKDYDDLYDFITK